MSINELACKVYNNQTKPLPKEDFKIDFIKTEISSMHFHFNNRVNVINTFKNVL